MEEAKLRKYAHLIAAIGGAVKEGQYVFIRTKLDQEKFAAMVAEECYKCGAKRVYVEWQSDLLTKVDYRLCSADELGKMHANELGLQEFLTEDLPVTIWLDGDDPDGLIGLDAAKMAKVRALRYAQSKPFITKRENKYQWTIVGCASLPWARKMFPNLSDEEAMEELWKAILYTARADGEDPVADWKKHNANLKKRAEWVSGLNLRWLVYKASNGTDLKVGLIPGVKFEAGGEETLLGVYFQPNMPTEECFTSPRKGEAEGIVYASKPLVYNSQLIKNFWIRFEKGKAVDCHAEQGEDLLRSIFSLDEGASYLGECALVPFSSPINQTGLIFYNTLYDENACCHLAIGGGFTNLYPNYDKYTEEELHSFGINESLSHVDFMIGTSDLSITGIDVDGKEIPLFRNGTWAD